MGADLGILRAEVRRIVMAGLAAAAAGPATARALTAGPPSPPGPGGRRIILAAGRFARDMAEAARGVLGPCETLIVTEAGRARSLEGARVLTAGWPVADLAGARAAEAAEAMLARAGAGDAVLLLLSAGAAAMLPAPAPGLTLGDLAEVERLMRAAGAGADEALMVGQQLSRLEGGGLAALAPAAALTALVVAEAEGAADPRRLARGMLAPPLGSRVTARALVELYGLWGRLPVRVLDRLAAAPERPRPVTRPRPRVVASGALAAAAMAAAGAGAMAVGAVTRPLLGGAVEIAHELLAQAAGLAPGEGIAFGLDPAAPGDLPDLTGEGAEAGEAAILRLALPVVAGAAGPRHAALGLEFALLARARRLPGPWALILTASDGSGRDSVAGVAVDSETLDRLAAAGIEAEAALRAGGAATVLGGIGAGFAPGPTGTDVGDLGLLLRG